MSGDALLMLELLNALAGGARPISGDVSVHEEMAIEMGWAKVDRNGHLQITLRGQRQQELMQHAWALVAPAAGAAPALALHATMERMARLLQSEDLWSRKAVQLVEAAAKAVSDLQGTPQASEAPKLIEVLMSPGTHLKALMSAEGVSPGARALLAAYWNTLPTEGVVHDEMHSYLGAQIAWVYAPLIAATAA